MPRRPEGKKVPEQTESPIRMDDPEQSRRFIEAARELGCDEDSAAFDRMFERLVPPKRKPESGAKAEPPRKRGRKPGPAKRS